MFTDPDTGFRVSMMGIGPWEALVQAHRAGNLVAAGHDEHLAYWRASGVMDADGAVDPDWVQILDVVAHSPSGLVMVAQQEELALFSNVHLDPDLTVVVRFRGRVQDGQLTQAEPMVEVSACYTRHHWSVLRRVVLRQAQDADGGLRTDADVGFRADADGGFRADADGGFRADADGGLSADADGGLRADADGGFRADAQPDAERGAQPDTGRRVPADPDVVPDASLVVTAGGPTIETPTTLAWYSTPTGLHRIQDGAVLAVDPGDVAHRLQQQVELALRR